MPREAMVGRLLKKAFFRQDSPAYRMMGGRKNLRVTQLQEKRSACTACTQSNTVDTYSITVSSGGYDTGSSVLAGMMGYHLQQVDAGQTGVRSGR